jgi:hypothetical protein
MSSERDTEAELRERITELQARLDEVTQERDFLRRYLTSPYSEERQAEYGPRPKPVEYGPPAEPMPSGERQAEYGPEPTDMPSGERQAEYGPQPAPPARPARPWWKFWA